MGCALSIARTSWRTVSAKRRGFIWRTQQHVKCGPRLLRERFVHLRRRRRSQAFLLDVADDPHDLAHVRGPRDVQPLADRVFIGEKAAGHRLVDEHNRRARGRVLFRDQSPANQRDLHHAQVRRRHPEIVGGRSARFTGPSIEADSHIGDAREWKGARDSHRLYARHVLQSIEQALRELDLLKRLAIDGPGQVDAHGEHVLRIEPERHVEQPPQTPEEQPGADQEHDGQGHFGDDERVADPSPLSRARGPAARLQRIMQIRSGQAKRRREPEEHTRADRQRNREHERQRIE